MQKSCSDQRDWDTCIVFDIGGTADTIDLWWIHYCWDAGGVWVQIKGSFEDL